MKNLHCTATTKITHVYLWKQDAVLGGGVVALWSYFFIYCKIMFKNVKFILKQNIILTEIVLYCIIL